VYKEVKDGLPKRNKKYKFLDERLLG